MSNIVLCLDCNRPMRVMEWSPQFVTFCEGCDVTTQWPPDADRRPRITTAAPARDRLTETLILRVSEPQVQRWKEAAQRREISLSQWVRVTLMSAYTRGE